MLSTRRAPLLVVAAALAACAGATRKAPAALGELRAALEETEPALRAEAAFDLGQLGLVERPEAEPESAAESAVRAAAAEALIPAASDPEPAVRRAAVEALGKLGGEDEEPALLAAAGDADAGVRGEAALALFRQRFLKRVPGYSTAAMTALLALSVDPEPEPRWRGVYALSRWPEPRARDVLLATQSDPDWRARLFAARALGKIGRAPDAALLADPDERVRAEAVAAYGAARAGESLPAAVFSDASAHVRAAAADALAAAGRPELAVALDAMADSDSPLPRGQALVALARLRGAKAGPLLSSARKDPHWWVRSRAYEASAGLPGAPELLRSGLADPDPRVAAASLEALARSTAPFVDELLGRILSDRGSALELFGTAVDAAAERASAALAEPLLAAARRRGPEMTAEIRGGIRKALAATAAARPERRQDLLAARDAFPTLTDRPRRFAKLSRDPVLVLETEKGDVELTLDAARSPNHAAAVAELAARGSYDGTIWHRVVSNFVVQGADPRGSGWGDAGFRLADEIGRIPFARGAVGMPKAGQDTGGGQLFVSLVPAPHLDGRYTAFGRVTAGLDALDRLEPGDRIKRARLRGEAR